jgi:hypothetical protein
MIAALLVLSACGKDATSDQAMATKTSTGDTTTSISAATADQKGVALVRVVNAVPGSAALTVRADTAHFLPGVSYKEVTPFISIDKSWVKFEVGGGPAGPYSTLATNREMLSDGHRYTMVIMRGKDATGYETRVLRDESSSDSLKAHLRVIHAASGFDAVNIVAKGGETLMEGVKFESDSPYKDLIPWTGILEVRGEKGKQLLLSLPMVDLRAGVSNTIVLTRSAAGKVEAFWFVDKPAM